MIDINKLVRENVKNLTPYSCARDDYKGKTGIFLDANENPYGKLNRYPDPYQKELKKAISMFRGIGEDNIFLGNGSDEIIDICFRVFCNPGVDKALTFTPTYGMYEVAASVNDVKVITIPLNEKFQIDITRAESEFSDKNLKLIFICSPNNPTSNSMNFSDVEYLISRFTGIVVIDEAYIDFSEKPSFIRLVGKYPNLILMQTFSKAMGLAAVRVGMAFADKQIIRYFNKVKPPYNISAINQRSALLKLSAIEQSRRQVNRIKKERMRLNEIMSKMQIIEKVFPSDANFFLIKVKDADSIYKRLVSNNIIIRNRSAVIDNCLRITIGTRNENEKLISALKAIPI